MLKKAKLSLRITNDEFDTEIADLIGACLLDLKMCGVNDAFLSLDTSDALIIQAVITYCKANFGYDNPDAERLREAYASLKNFLAIVYRK